jgi:hypothetical protein
MQVFFFIDFALGHVVKAHPKTSQKDKAMINIDGGLFKAAIDTLARTPKAFREQTLIIKDAAIEAVGCECIARASLPFQYKGEPICLPFSIVKPFCASATGPLVVHVEKKQVRIESGQASLVLAKKDNPAVEIVNFSSVPAGVFNADNFAKALDAIRPAVNPNECRSFLRGARLTPRYIEGTNGKLLLRRHLRCSGDFPPTTIPAEMLPVLHSVIARGVGEVLIRRGQGVIAAECDTYCLQWMEVHGDWPDTEQFFANHAKTIDFSASPVLEALRIADKYCGDAGVEVEVDGGVCVVRAETEGAKYETVINDFSGSARFCAKPKYLIAALECVGTATALRFKSSVEPLIFEGADGQALVMPIKKVEL